jgi:hypothetical protein
VFIKAGTELMEKWYVLGIVGVFLFSLFFQEINSNSLIGEWYPVEVEEKGYQKFSTEIKEMFFKSKLIIEKKKIFYCGIPEIEVCHFDSLGISSFDVEEYRGLPIYYKYTEEELSRFKVVSPLDYKGKFSCFNDCSIFFFNEDTLINLCGGYTVYLKKKKTSKPF